MKLAYFIKKSSLVSDSRVSGLLAGLRDAGHGTYAVNSPRDITPGTDLLLSMGGDGTFLDAARIAVPAGIPVAGVNFGRMGFLSEYDPEVVLSSLRDGAYAIERRALLQVSGCSSGGDFPYALNEISVSRAGAAMLGIDLEIDGAVLPTCWADGMIVATSSGSTAYALSVGGPICTPDSRVFIVAPVSPHNLNVRPLIIPETSKVRISFRSREESVNFTIDNSSRLIPSGTVLDIEAAPVSLERLRMGSPNFINALRSRLHWGDDVRNSTENYK